MVSPQRSFPLKDIPCDGSFSWGGEDKAKSLGRGGRREQAGRFGWPPVPRPALRGKPLPVVGRHFPWQPGRSTL